MHIETFENRKKRARKENKKDEIRHSRETNLLFLVDYWQTFQTISHLSLPIYTYDIFSLAHI